MENLLYHLRFSIRVFRKDKFFSILNILGLALGITVSIILMLILKSDFSYDKHYSKYERIFRLGAHYVIPDVDEMIGVTAREFGPILKQTYPEIEELVRVHAWESTLVKGPANQLTKSFYEDRIAQVDSSYFKLFDHAFVAGDVSTCLNDPSNIVITKSTSRKYFGEAEALNKTLIVNDKSYQITAVIEDFPETTHLKFDILVAGLPEIRSSWDFTMKNGKPIALVMWNPDVYTYLLMPEEYDVTNFYKRYQPIYEAYFVDTDKDSPFLSANTVGANATNRNEPFLQRLDKIHMSGIDDERSGNMKYLIALAAIGGLIVLLACINYMNLATAKAVKRATEISMKRISGSGRNTLVVSLIGESVALAMISLVLAMGLVYTIIGATSFNVLIGKHLSPDVFSDPTVFLTSFAIALTIGILSGMYPAFFLSSIPVLQALKGSFKNSRSGLLLRKSLIAVQFGVSIFVVVCTLFMSNQLSFLRTKNLGFNKDNLLVIELKDERLTKQISTITSELKQDPRIENAAIAGQVIGAGVGMEQMFAEGPNGMEQRGCLALMIGDDYLEMMGIELLSGRLFQKGEDIETEGFYLANESAVKLMGWGDDAIGKKVSFWDGMNPGKVIGVVKDFNVNSLHRGVDPMFIIKGHYGSGNYHIRLTGEDVPGVVEMLKEKFSKLDPEHPFEYFFLHQKFDEQYRYDLIQNKLLSVLSYVCVFISLLGLLGLSAFAAVQRTKEIGVRKVLGASVPSILIMLSKDVMVLVLIASVIAAPMSWWVIDGWLAGFAYRAPINILLLAMILIGSLLFVLIVTAFQSLKTARTNPVNSLKYE